jgi:hypothetical protein
MRKASPERPKADQLVGDKEDSRDETASARGKNKKKNKRKALKKDKWRTKGGEEQDEPNQQSGEAGSTRLPQQPRGQGQGSDQWRSDRRRTNVKIEDDPKRGVFRTEDARFLRSS